MGWSYLIIVNIIGLVLMGWDKRQAMAAGWRVSERTLLWTALIGGSIGVFAGMRLFRHKTRHGTFSIGVPIIILGQAALLAWLTAKQ